MKKAIRFQPDPLDYALIDFSEDDQFNPTSVGLILNESFTGCALVFKTMQPPQTEQIIKVKVGRLNPLRARVVWGKILEEGLIKVGLQFLE